MSKKVSMSLARPSKAQEQATTSEPSEATKTSSTSDATTTSDVQTTSSPSTPATTTSKQPANSEATPSKTDAKKSPRAASASRRPAQPTAAAMRLEEGTKRIVVDVVPAVHKQVKVKSVEFSGGIKEYVLRLLEADGIDMRAQPDFVPRPKGAKGTR